MQVFPVAFYGFIMLGAGVAYSILTRVLIHHHGKNSTLAIALGRDFKGKLSLLLYTLAIPFAFVQSWIACGLYVVGALIWLIPDHRIERNITT